MLYQFIPMLKRHTKAKSEFIVGELVQEEKKSEPVFKSIAKKNE